MRLKIAYLRPKPPVLAVVVCGIINNLLHYTYQLEIRSFACMINFKGRLSPTDLLSKYTLA